MISRKRLKLFPIIFELRIFGLQYKRIGYCCNLDYYMWKPWILFQFAFRDKIYWRCSQCGKLHSLKLSYHIEEVWDKELREENKLLKEW